MHPGDADQADVQLEWVARIREGDAAAFEALFMAYYRPLVSFATGFLKTREAAEELVQDVFLKLWAERERLEVRQSVRTFLYVATRNRALNWTRRQQLERRWTAGVGEGEPESTHVLPRAEHTDERASLAELDAAIQEAIARLPARCRETFVLSRQHNLTHEQIAQLMGVSVKTVQEQMGRALRALRASLAPWLD